MKNRRQDDNALKEGRSKLGKGLPLFPTIIADLCQLEMFIISTKNICRLAANVVGVAGVVVP